MSCFHPCPSQRHFGCCFNARGFAGSRNKRSIITQSLKTCEHKSMISIARILVHWVILKKFSQYSVLLCIKITYMWKSSIWVLIKLLLFNSKLSWNCFFTPWLMYQLLNLSHSIFLSSLQAMVKAQVLVCLNRN